MHGTVALANPRTPEQSPAGRFPFHFPVFRRHFIHRRFCSNTRFSAFPGKAWPEETTSRDISSVPAKQVPSYEKPECRATTQRRKRPCSCTDSKKISERHVLLIQLLRVKKRSAVLPLVVPPLMCPLPEKTAKYLQPEQDFISPFSSQTENILPKNHHGTTGLHLPHHETGRSPAKRFKKGINRFRQPALTVFSPDRAFTLSKKRANCKQRHGWIPFARKTGLKSQKTFFHCVIHRNSLCDPVSCNHQ